MDIASLLDFIPKQLHLPAAALALILYYGFPRFQAWRIHKRYYDVRTRILEYKKLLYEVEGMRKKNDVSEVQDSGLQDLQVLAEGLRPKQNALPRGRRFLAGWVGSLIAFFIFALLYFAVTPEEPLGDFILGAFILSLVAGIPTLLYRADKLYKSALFGGGAGLVLALVIGLLIGA